MIIIVSVLILLLVSFLWALISLRKILRQQNDRTSSSDENNLMSDGEEIVLFDRKS